MLRSQSKSPYSTPVGERSLPKHEENQQVMSWPDNVLDSGSDVGLPEDGGFGTDHFGPEEQSDAEIVENKKLVQSPFSSLRGAFREIPQLQNDEKGVDSNEHAPAERMHVSDDKVPSEAGSLEKEDHGLTHQTDITSRAEGAPDVSPLAAPGVGTDNFDKVEGSNRTPVLVNENIVSLKETSNSVSSSLSQNSNSAGFNSESPDISEEGAKSQLSKTGENVEASPDSVPESTTPGSSESYEPGLEQMLSEVRDLVKRGRRKDVGDIVSSRCFKDAVEILRAAPDSWARSVPLMAEYGSALIAWARRDLRGENAENRLRQARGILTSCVEEEPENEGCLFNLSLCLCLLASLQDAPGCEELYKEACVYYDRLAGLNIKSRIVFFNAGLAYISRARLGQSSKSPDQTYVFEMYKKASVMFSSALELQPEDSKSRLYLDECQEKLRAE